MEKMDGKTMDIVAENLGKLKELFPEAFTEGKVDFDALKEVLGAFVDDRDERYSFTWNGKSKARMIAQTPSTGTLRPCKEESVDWDSTQNIFIEGDNLEVLKLLQKSYHKKVKMIYIDPPYNTGKDFVYKDNFKDNIKNYKEITGQVDGEGRNLSNNPETSGRYHTDWLNMMYPRLKLARNLLKDDGVIFISIDDNEVSNLRKMCDEIYGEENFVDPIIWKKRYGGGAKEKFLVALHEYALMYVKSKESLDNLYIPLPAESIDRYYKNKDEFYSEKGGYRTHPLEAMKSFDDRDNLNFPIRTPNGDTVWPKRQWRWSKERVDVALERNEIEFSQDKDGNWILSSKQYLKDESGEIRKTKPFTIIDDIYTQHGTNQFVELFGNAKIFDFPKPSRLIYKLLEIGFNSSDNNIFLDFFAGSGASAQALIDYNLALTCSNKFILVQLPEVCNESSYAYKSGYKNIAEISKERIRRSATKIKEENPEYDVDLGFKVFKLDSTNIKPWEVDFDMTEHTLEDFISNIKSDRREEDVLYEILLKYGLDLTLPITEHVIAGQKVFDIGMGALIICLSDAISLEVVEGIAMLKDELNPEIMRVVFKDSGFKDDVVKTNAVQILKQAGIVDVRSL
ncbi:site-specific DNA-methyltransferase [Desulfobacter vibrioformis]|uniref:site-specific DNA-methyltransferase n=1 Tax=Desulfobacter vibrioformis TaxID=34031 RepID=UPI00054DF3F6|nr:site-specific DNA-methyltransferase [Desulfobacter vibrioformis]